MLTSNINSVLVRIVMNMFKSLGKRREPDEKDISRKLRGQAHILRSYDESKKGVEIIGLMKF